MKYYYYNKGFQICQKSNYYIRVFESSRVSRLTMSTFRITNVGSAFHNFHGPRLPIPLCSYCLN